MTTAPTAAARCAARVFELGIADAVGIARHSGSRVSGDPESCRVNEIPGSSPSFRALRGPIATPGMTTHKDFGPQLPRVASG
jgi:hypothetical protein